MPAEYTGEQKLRIVLESIIRGVPKEEQCKKYGISAEQFQNWHDHLIKNGGKIYEQGAPRHKNRTTHPRKVKFIPWYIITLLILSVMVNLGAVIVWMVWKMSPPHDAKVLSDVFPIIETVELEQNETKLNNHSFVAKQNDLELESLIKQVDQFSLQDEELKPASLLVETPVIKKRRELSEMLNSSTNLPEKPTAGQLASEVEFLGQKYEGKHVVYLLDVGGYQLEGEGAVQRMDRMKIAVLDSLTKLSGNSYFNVVLCWNLREAHALGKTILRASDENKKYATDWITSLGTTLEGLKEGRNQFYPKELLYAKPLIGVVGPWYGLSTAMSYDPDLVFFLVGNMPMFRPEEVSRVDFNGLGIDSGVKVRESNSGIDQDSLKSVIRKTAGYWLISLQSERNLPTATADIEDIAMTRLGLNDWTGSNIPKRLEIPWEKTFDNFLAGLELGIDKIPRVHAFQTLPDFVVWPSPLQNSFEEFCESSRGSLNLFP